MLGMLLLVTGLLVGAAQIGMSTYQGVTYKCLVDGPFSSQAEVSEGSDVVEGSVAWWPLGRACEWARADGAGTVTVYSGSWALTFIALGLILGALVLAVTSVRPRRRRTSPLVSQ
ncbi:hypothetical protein C5C13_11595 [Clavibacter michiganensis]|nr:hypothetical protein C5C13_11595 [Clavibacter michiganensis]